MRALVVTDTSCLIAFERIERLNVLPELYEVLAPERVVQEFGWQPAWLRMHPVGDRASIRRLEEANLDPGEAEAIALALTLPGCTLLIDEARGRREAARLGLDVVGTLGVLVRAKRQGLIPAVRPEVERLRSDHGFRVSDAVIAAALQEAGER